LSDAMWYYAVDGVRNGPVPHAELCTLFARSGLTLETQVWSPGMEQWAEAKSVADFRDIWGKGFVAPSGATPTVSAVGRPTLAPAVTSSFAAAARTSPPHRPSRGVDATGRARPAGRRWDESPQVRPWVRYFARGLDSSLLIVAAIYLFSTAWPEGLVYFPYILVGSLILHPIQLTLFGTTLGKFVFGISVEAEDGEPPTLGQAAAREFAVLVKGMGLNILFLPLVTMAAAYRRLTAEGVTSWDRDGGLIVRHRPVGAFRWAAWLMLSLAMGVYALAAAGELDVGELARRDTFSGVRRVRAAEVTETYDNNPATQPAAPKKPRPKPKLLSLPTDPPPASPTIKPKSPTTRPAKPNRPPPRVIFKPAPAPES
jgi:uncharacterized RDD family membrane protein YckC